MPEFSKRARACWLLLVLPVLGFGPCSGEEEVRAAEAQRAAVLARTRPKSEFWAQVERKGAAAKAEKAAAEEIAKEKAEREALTTEVTAAGARLADGKTQRAVAEAAQSDATERLEKARAERARREETLAGFAARQRARDAS